MCVRLSCCIITAELFGWCSATHVCILPYLNAARRSPLSSKLMEINQKLTGWKEVNLKCNCKWWNRISTIKARFTFKAIFLRQTWVGRTQFLVFQMENQWFIKTLKWKQTPRLPLSFAVESQPEISVPKQSVQVLWCSVLSWIMIWIWILLCKSTLT